MTPREPRAYRFARYLGRALGNPDPWAVLGAGWVTAGAWSLNEAAGKIVLGGFFLVWASVLTIQHARTEDA